jgi:riboflavin biosynthesis pyrimidine reductase
MVEGGAQVLRGFLQEKLAHVIILTIAPKFFGNSGSFYSEESGVVLPFEIKSTIFKQIGVDMVMIGYPLFI